MHAGPRTVGEGMNPISPQGLGLVVDLFAGGGGGSVGLEAALGRPVDIAVNHDPTAIAVHTANHARTKHYTASVWDIRPREATGGREVDTLWASPDCTHFSIARGGKPKEKGTRSLAWVVVKWAREVRPRSIFVENVREFQTWGPLDELGHPIPHLKGHTFKTWVGTLRGLGYVVDWRILNAADFGAPTARRRLFIVARRVHDAANPPRIEWPEKSHGPATDRPYRTAAECIDWSIPCPSIFERKKPLAEKTLWRIANGIKRFVLDNPRPFIVPIQNFGWGDKASAADEPLRTITAGPKGGGFAVATPFLATTGYGEGPKQGPRVDGVEAPMPTVVSTGIHRGLVAPALVKVNHCGQEARGEDPAKPLSTVTAAQRGHALCAAFLAKHFGGVVGQQLSLPLGTVTARDHQSLAAANLVKLRGQCHGSAADEPMPTLTGQGFHVAEVRSFLVAYYGCDKDGQGLLEPMRTITVRDRLGLVTVEGVEYQIVDIGMRMLEPHELLRAQFGEFAEGYDLSPARTKTAKVRLIGNSVCPHVVRDLVAANTRRAEVVAA